MGVEDISVLQAKVCLRKQQKDEATALLSDFKVVRFHPFADSELPTSILGRPISPTVLCSSMF